MKLFDDLLILARFEPAQYQRTQPPRPQPRRTDEELRRGATAYCNAEARGPGENLPACITYQVQMCRQYPNDYDMCQALPYMPRPRAPQSPRPRP